MNCPFCNPDRKTIVDNKYALAMILFNHILSIVLMVGLGLLFLWRSGIDIREARLTEEK